jgi:hypothetical protein
VNPPAPPVPRGPYYVGSDPTWPFGAVPQPSPCGQGDNPNVEAYELANGAPIVEPDPGGRAVRADFRASYLPATLVSGAPPAVHPGVDLSREANVAAAVRRRRTLYDVSATPLTTLRDGTRGLFLVKSAQRISAEAIERGFLVLFIPEASVNGGVSGTSAVQLVGGGSRPAYGSRSGTTGSAESTKRAARG